MPQKNILPQISINNLVSSGWADYELLDSGNQQKLERFGPYLLARFEPEAVWKPALSPSIWASAHASFTIKKGTNQGHWKINQAIPKEWRISLDPLTIHLVLKNSRHVGIFPEQTGNWQWIQAVIQKAPSPLRVLNLFGYSGIATAYASLAGAEITHVDASSSAVNLARKNIDASGLKDKPVRWIVDDVLKFIQKEIRRGNSYNGIILDPPKFGRGPKGEIWKFEKSINEMLAKCVELINPHPVFIILTAYQTNLEPRALGNILDNNLKAHAGKIQCGQLIQQEKSAGRKIAQSIYARWENFN